MLVKAKISFPGLSKFPEMHFSGTVTHINIFPTLQMKGVQLPSPPYPYTHMCCVKDMLLDVISCHLHNVFLLFLQIFWRTLSRLHNICQRHRHVTSRHSRHCIDCVLLSLRKMRDCSYAVFI